MDTVIQVKNIFIPWDYAVISTYIPKDGEMVCVKNAPNFTGQNRTVMGDGTHNVAWLIAQIIITPSDMQQEIIAEQTARINADNTHAALTAPHGATATPTENRIAMYGASSGLKSEKVPTEANDVIRKTEMDAEATARASAITTEQQARESSDTNEAIIRQGQFDAAQTSAAQEVTDRTAAVATEKSERQAADTAIQGQITTAITTEQQARAQGDTSEATARQAQFDSLSGSKQDKKPDGTNALVGTDGKLNQVYLPSSILGAMIYGGTFSTTGIINASSYATALQGIKIDSVNTAQYPGYYFISQGTYVFGGNNFTAGDWAISQGNHTPAWVEIDNGNAVSSVNGKIGAVVLAKADVGLGNVDNTPDSQKPVSQAQQAAITAASQADQAAVTQEAQDRAASVTAEAQARAAADTVLQGNIDADTRAWGLALSIEAQVRAAADAAEIQARTNAVSQEAQDRAAADAAIQEEVDGIPGVYAPINSPHFTGVPLTPEPSYTVPDQVADVRGLMQMRALIIVTLLPGARATRTPNNFMSPVRITQRGRVRGTYAA